MSKDEGKAMDIQCECGGTLKPAKLDTFDFSPLAGIPVILVGVPGLRCQKCKRVTLEGEVINRAIHDLVTQIVKLPDRLLPAHARFLRKHLRLTQQALAERMGIARETVADWERGQSPISAQHDLMLRAIVIAHLMLGRGRAPKRRDIVEAIGAARIHDPPKGAVPPPLRIGCFVDG
jgi:DNA-binding transcriptional regulator YiaG